MNIDNIKVHSDEPLSAKNIQSWMNKAFIQLCRGYQPSKIYAENKLYNFYKESVINMGRKVDNLFYMGCPVEEKEIEGMKFVGGPRLGILMDYSNLR